MKIASIALASLMTAAVTGVARGQEAHEAHVIVSNGRAQAVADDMSQALAGVAEAKMEKVAFLGVVATPVPAALREQLDLKRGLGLVVGSVEKDGPADQAGLKKFDILTKLDDQLLVNPQQFGTLVRMHAPGDQVKITILRKGQEQTLTAKLIGKEMPTFAWNDDQNLQIIGGNWPAELAKFSTGAPEIDIERALDVGDDNVTSIGITDSEHTASLTIQDGHKTLNIKKKDGTVVFDGPVNTPEQRAQLSPELRAKLERLESRPTMIRMKLRPRVAAPSTAPSAP